MAGKLIVSLFMATAFAALIIGCSGSAVPVVADDGKLYIVEGSTGASRSEVLNGCVLVDRNLVIRDKMGVLPVWVTQGTEEPCNPYNKGGDVEKLVRDEVETLRKEVMQLEAQLYNIKKHQPDNVESMQKRLDERKEELKRFENAKY